MSEAAINDDLTRRMGASQADHHIRNISRTHDIPFTEFHIQGIEKLGADLNEAVQAAWPKRHSIRYSRVRVLLLSWQADDLGVDAEIEPLRRVLEDRYHFEVGDYKIPSTQADTVLNQRIFDFTREVDKDTLLIVYYAGHARGALQSNEASLWYGNRDDYNSVARSGVIQARLEDADADVVLFCDCCHTTIIPTTDSQPGNNKVMEAMTACGYETIAAEVGDHSFTKALTHVLAIASKGQPFTISKLHSRVISKLKCWTPELLKGEDGNYVDTAENRLLFEHQPRRTPIFTVVCEANPIRSIVLAPLGKIYPSPSDSGGESQSSGEMSQANMDVDDAGEGPSNEHEAMRQWKKRKRSIDDEGRYPFILLAARLEKRYDKQAWLDWIRNAPNDVKDIHTGGAFASFSTLLLVRTPAAVWNLLPRNPAYTFFRYVTSGNYALSEGCNCTSAYMCEICDRPPPSPIRQENAVTSAQLSGTSQSRRSELLSMRRPLSPSPRVVSSLAEPTITRPSNTDSIWGGSSRATSMETSRSERERSPTTGTSSFFRHKPSPSYSALPHLQLSSNSRSIPSMTEPSNTLSSMDLDRDSLSQDTKKFSEPPLTTSRTGLPPKSSSVASFVSRFRGVGKSSEPTSTTSISNLPSTASSLASLFLDRGRSLRSSNIRRGYMHSSRHHQNRTNKGAEPEYRWEWLWSCCACCNHGGMSTFIEQCPDLTCAHFQCESCPMESVKIRAE